MPRVIYLRKHLYPHHFPQAHCIGCKVQGQRIRNFNMFSDGNPTLSMIYSFRNQNPFFEMTCSYPRFAGLGRNRAGHITTSAMIGNL
jgi:hypothetical protein